MFINPRGLHKFPAIYCEWIGPSEELKMNQELQEDCFINKISKNRISSVQGLVCALETRHCPRNMSADAEQI